MIAAAHALATTVLLAAAAPTRAGAGFPEAVRQELDGGLELLVVPIPGAPTVSLRYVVRVGSAHDPPGQEGLAHLLEHLLAQGRDLGLRGDVLVSGGDLNAFTSRDATRYLLDAPAGAFPALAERLLRSITDPRLDPADIAREQAVVGREDFYGDDGPSVFELLEDALFAPEDAEAGPVGTPATRAQIGRTDLIRFFTEGYTTRATTVVLAGAITLEEARALVERAVMLPPALPEERLPPRAVPPKLPATSKLRAGFLAASVGYSIRPTDREACQPLAELVELRLLTELRLREPLVREVEVACTLLRGNPFLLAIAHGPSIEATDLPERIDAVLHRAASSPPDARERGLLERRLWRRAEREARDPAARASALADDAARPRREGPTELRPPTPAPLPIRGMTAAARDAFRPARRALLFLSPFEGEPLGGDGEDEAEEDARE